MKKKTIMADALVGTLADHLIQAFKHRCHQVNEFEPELNNLKTQLDFMKAFMADASRHKRKDEMVRTTLNIIRDLIYEADDILTDCIIHDDYRKENSYLRKFSAREKYFRYKTVEKLKKINFQIEKMKGTLPPYFQMMAIYRDQEQKRCSRRWTSPVFDESSIIGLRDDEKKIINWILPPTIAPIKIVIIGMGGLGKTTIAKIIFNHEMIKARFQKKIWVSVSQTVNEESIFKSMLKQLGEDITALDEGQILQKIQMTLLNCSFLLVMDDVWSVADGWWNKLSDGLPKSERHRNAIIITTRDKAVAKEMGVKESQIHHPKILNEQESWSLFTKFAFLPNEEMKLYPELKEVAKNIIRKCQGLPLAIKTISCLLRTKNKSISVWRGICDNFLEELCRRGSEGSVIASLQLSYDELPIRLKNCLLCCSICPEDSNISADWLIRWWVGEGFIEYKEIETAYNYLSELADRCLIEVVKKRDYDGKVHLIKMHDLVRDLIIKIAEDEAFCSSRPNQKIHRLAITESMDLNQLNYYSRLRSLLVQTSCPLQLENKIDMARFNSLRVLDLSYTLLGATSIKELFEWISSLKRLSYLKLTGNNELEKVPRSIGKLKTLEVLIFSLCKNLKQLPVEINSLQKLKILDVRCCPILSLPPGLSKLTNLQELSGFNMSSGCHLHELRCLKQLVVLKIQLTSTSKIQDD